MLLRLGIRIHVIRLFLIVAIISATISPACAFISGKYGDWVEICAGNQVQKIQIKDDTEIPDVAQSQCDFCFQQLHASAILTDIPVILPMQYMFVRHEFVSERALINFVSSHRARAPPSLS